MTFDRKQYMREWHQKNRERRNAAMREWNRKNKPAGRGHHLPYMLMHKYGISLEDYNSLVEAQDNCCAICGQQPLGTNIQNQRLHVDHDEATGRIRGLLCGSCNRAIGLLKHDIDFLIAAINYLDESE